MAGLTDSDAPEYTMRANGTGISLEFYWHIDTPPPPPQPPQHEGLEKATNREFMSTSNHTQKKQKQKIIELNLHTL